ncbi:MAG: SOS response-associated peptidase family protein, partial [Asticcacaulis sp.]
GKFTAKAKWAEIVEFIYSDPLKDDDRTVTHRVMGNLPVIVRDADERRVMGMRWGFPDPSDWRKPRPIHARSETIDTMPAFADAFRDGQRGIVLVETFNEAPDNGEQHTVTPAGPVGIAFVWRRFQAAEQAILACVMATVPANSLLMGLPTDRMPAILAPDDWAIWLGETDTSPAEVKACLRTVEDARWTMTREERAKTTRRAKPTVSDPAGLF